MTADTPGVVAQYLVCFRVSRSSIVKSSLRINSVAGMTPCGTNSLILLTSDIPKLENLAIRVYRGTRHVCLNIHARMSSDRTSKTSTLLWLSPFGLLCIVSEDAASVFWYQLLDRTLNYPETIVTFETISYEVNDNIARLTINRPESYNAVNGQATKDLHDIVNLMAGDDRVRAVVITGAGDKAFCAGGDIAEFHENRDRLDALVREMTGYLHIAISRLAWLNAPVIAAVNGAAAGAGLSLAACCDLVIASDQAKFSSAYTRIGLTPDGSSTYFLTRVIGRRRALEMYLTNRTLSAQEALDWGLVNRVVPADQLAGEVNKLAAQLASGPTLAHGGVKRLVLMSPNDTLESQMERETREIAAMVKTEDARHGIESFVKKEKPNFEGK